MKTLTIVVPSYNVESYLEKTLESFIVPDYMEELEVIIVDDGSKDGTSDIGRTYVERYPETFILINKENGGHGSTVNTGIINATGKYFRIVDGDDWVDKKALIKLLNVLKQADTDLVVTHYRTVNVDTGEKTDILFDDNICDKSITVSDTLRQNLFFPMATVCYKTTLLKRHNIRLQEKLFYVDEEYNVLPFAYTESIYCCDCILYNYRIGNINQSISIKNQINRIEHKCRVAERLIDFVEKTNMPKENKEYCYKKVQGLVTSVYLIMLIYDPDKKQAVSVAKHMRNMVKDKSPLLYNATDKKYKIFKLLNVLPFRKSLYEKLMESASRLSKKGRIKYV